MAALIKDPTELQATSDDLDKTYTALGKGTEWWVGVGRGTFLFRSARTRDPKLARL
jgi:hypothetical protein